jgi:hypothetical protein
MRVTDNGKIVWSERVEKRLLKRLYESDAEGLVDERLLDEVGYALYARCADILYLADFKRRDFRCPRCEMPDESGPQMVDAGESCVCPDCGFSISRDAMRRSFIRKQLNPGGAVPAFEKYVRDWRRASTAQQRMLAIDAVIHSFHYSLKDMPGMPTRAAGVNLIEGKLGDVVDFLDRLSANDDFQTELSRCRALWEGWRNRHSQQESESDI